MTTASSNLEIEVPGGAKRLEKVAGEHGWTVATVATRGTRLGAKKDSDNVTVRLTKGARRLVGVWVDGSFSAGLVGLNGQQLLITLNSRELSAAVKA